MKIITLLISLMIVAFFSTTASAGGNSYANGHVGAGSNVTGMGVGSSFGGFETGAGTMSWTGGTYVWASGITSGRSDVFFGGMASEGGFSSASGSAGESFGGTYANTSSSTMSTTQTFGFASAMNSANANVFADAMNWIE